MIRVANDSDSEGGFVWVGRSGERALGDAAVSRDLSAYDSAVVAIVEAIEAAGSSPVGPDRVLDDIVDTDCLEQLFDDKESGRARAGGTLTFDAWGVTVVVTKETVHAVPTVDDEAPTE